MSEWATEIGAYLSKLPLQNEIGIIGGIAAGFSYAMYHIYKDARKHHARASFSDATLYAASTESGCVISATLAEYISGKIISTAHNPLAQSNIPLRLGSLVPSFGLGLLVMSAFTYAKKKEVCRFISEKDTLHKLQTEGRLEVRYYGKHMKVRGNASGFMLTEKRHPKVYHNEFDAKNFSLYVISSRLARAKPAYAGELEEYVFSMFKNAG